MGTASQQPPCIGSMMNVLSKSNVRYVGILAAIDVKECTIGLARVRCYGTEGRPAKREIPGSERVHDHIVFKAVDIQDLYALGGTGGGGAERIGEAKTPYPATPIDDPAIVSQSSQSPPRMSRSAPQIRSGFVDQEPDFDFESANQQFQREALDVDDASRRFPGVDASSMPGSMKRNEVYYDKKVSFFDSISTGTRTRGSGTNWLRSMKTNEETFGPSSSSEAHHQTAQFTPVTSHSRYHPSPSVKHSGLNGTRPKRSSTFHVRR